MADVRDQRRIGRAPRAKHRRVGRGQRVEDHERDRADDDQQHDHPEQAADDVADHDGGERARRPAVAGRLTSLVTPSGRAERQVPVVVPGIEHALDLGSLDQGVIGPDLRDRRRVVDDLLVDLGERRQALPALVMPAALLRALFTFGSLSTGQLALLTGTIAWPLNGMNSAAYGSGKSSIQPAVGHTLTCAYTYPQNFEYMVCCGTALIVVLNPSVCRPD